MHANKLTVSDINNNKMKRLNGEIRDREKVMRGLKKEDTPCMHTKNIKNSEQHNRKSQKAEALLYVSVT